MSKYLAAGPRDWSTFINSCSQTQQTTNNSNEPDVNQRKNASDGASSHGHGRSDLNTSNAFLFRESVEKVGVYDPKNYPMIERNNRARESKKRTPLDIRNHLRVKAVSRMQENDFRGTIECGLEALRLTEQIPGTQRADSAPECLLLAKAYATVGQSEEAEFYLERTVAMAKKRPFAEPLVNASLYIFLAEIYTILSDTRSADHMYHLYRARVEADYGLDHLATSDAYNMLASVYTQFGKYAKALEFGNKALAIRINQLGHQHKATADSHYNLGLLHRLNGNTQEAKRAFGFSIDIRTRVFGHDSLQVAEVALSIGFTEHQSNNLSRAHKQYEIAYLIRATHLGSAHLDTLEALKLLDAVRLNQGRAKYTYAPGKNRLAEILTSTGPGSIGTGTFEVDQIKRAVGVMVQNGDISVESGDELIRVVISQGGNGNGSFKDEVSAVQLRACVERVTPGIAVDLLQQLLGGNSDNIRGRGGSAYDVESKSDYGGDTAGRMSGSALQATIDILSAQAVLQGRPPAIPDDVIRSIMSVANSIEGKDATFSMEDLRLRVSESDRGFLDILIRNVQQHSDPRAQWTSGDGYGTGNGLGPMGSSMGGSGSGNNNNSGNGPGTGSGNNSGNSSGTGSGENSGNISGTGYGNNSINSNIGSGIGNGDGGSGSGLVLGTEGGNGSGGGGNTRGAALGVASNGSRTKQMGLSGPELWGLFNSRVGALGVIPMLIHDERARVAKVNAEAQAQARQDREEKEEGSKPKATGGDGLADMLANKANNQTARKAPPSGPKSDLKRLHWDVLDDTTGTVWDQLDGGDGLDDVFGDLKDEFSTKKSAKDVNSAGGDDKSKPKQIALVADPKRRQNMSIFVKTLTKGDRTMEQVADLVDLMDTESLGINALQSFVEFVPEPEEVDIVKEYMDAGGDKDLLGPAEKFIFALSNVKRLNARITSMRFKASFNEQVQDLEKDNHTLSQCCVDVRTSKRLTKLLSIVLKLGNELNKGTYKGGAAGIKIGSLMKLTQTKTNRNVTLLEYIVNSMMDKDPELLEFADDMPGLEAASRCNLQAMNGELGKLRVGVKQIGNTVKIAQDDAHFVNAMSDFLERANLVFETVEDKFKHMKEEYEVLCKYFGEKSQKMAPDELFGTMKNFSNLFVASVKKVKETRERKERQIRRETEKKKMVERASAKSTSG